MLQQTDIYLQRLIALRDEGFAQAERMREEGRLDFSTYRSCLICAWCETNYARADGWVKDKLGYPIWKGGGLSRCYISCAEYFGLTCDTRGALFGAGLTLSERRTNLGQLIAERMGVAA
jgi:hypothetical protein